MRRPRLSPFAALALLAPLGAQDLAADVQKACTSPRLGLRIAASRKVAAAGDAAVPAVRGFVREHGQEQLPVALVEAIADHAGNGEAVLGLLEDWTADRDFFWRAQALRGLALRAPQLPQLRQRLLALFCRDADDPAWLTRVFARLGRELLRPTGEVGKEPAAETDPRALRKLAVLRLELGQLPPLQPLLDALVDERGFLGDPWGRRAGLEAWKALQRWLGDDCGYRPEASAAANAAALQRLQQALAARSGQQLVAPVPQRDRTPELAGGVEVLSCRNGDLFVGWTAGGTLRLGLEQRELPLATDRWQQLRAAAAELALPPQSGVVICDRLILVAGGGPGAQAMAAAVAPAALPAAAAAWLKQLAAAIEEAGDAAAAAALRDRLAQFAAR